MNEYKTYCIEYIDFKGNRKIYRSKTSGTIKEYSRYDNALKVKNWFLDKGYEQVKIKEIYY